MYLVESQMLFITHAVYISPLMEEEEEEQTDWMIDLLTDRQKQKKGSLGILLRYETNQKKN